MKLTSKAFFALCLILPAFAFGENEEALAEAATKQLSTEQNAIVFFAEGMGCQSCAIGVQDELIKLTFVDQSRLEKGMKFDLESKLVTVAITANGKIDAKAMSNAIETAGYDPIRMYALVNGKLQVSALPKS